MKASAPRFQSDVRNVVLMLAPILILLIIGLVLAFRFVEPAPPRTILMAAGAEDGAYSRFAAQYRAFLAERGVELEILHTAGSIENLAHLRNASSGVEIALVQGGTRGADIKQAPLSSLASLFTEPLWIFYRSGTPLRRLDELAGLTVAVGPEGSGTRALALRLLADAGVEDAVDLSELSGEKAANALIAGELDAAMYVIAPDAPVIRQLADDPTVRLMDLARAEGLAQRHRFLTLITLHRGALSLQRDMPPTDVQLPAAIANLVARDDLHPSLVSLLMQAITRVHGLSGTFHEAGTFPSADNLQFPLREEARRFLERGPPFLQRFLPFWIADFIDRAIVLLIPLIAIALPLFRIFPPLYAWRMRARVNHWYKEVEAVEEAYRADPNEATKAMATDRLHQIDKAAQDVEVPLTYAHMVYRLRQHIALVGARISDTRFAHTEGTGR
ncbi:MAG: TAXI family TRAP transporter solute-binding subunit [Pseudomonadota bacterium]